MAKTSKQPTSKKKRNTARNKRFISQFIRDVIERAVKTFCQVLVGFIGAGVAFGDVEWSHAISVAGVAAITSVLTSIASYNIGEKGTASLTDGQ